jgi:surfeit locus 1 family protein
MQPMQSVWTVARRPHWLGALAFALVVAGVFAWLGQWQWERSIDTATVVDRNTEQAVPLVDVAQPQSIITSDASGRMVSVECQMVPGDDVWVTNRPSPQGPQQWLVRHCLTEEGNSLAVVVGSSPSDVEVPVASSSESYLGRYVPTESPQASDFESGERSAVSVAELINLWREPGPAYGGYLVLAEAPEGLTSISTEPPSVDRQLNWLNIFYAAEWVIFAFFALYLWLRLVKDEWERELEEASARAE